METTTTDRQQAAAEHVQARHGTRRIGRIGEWLRFRRSGRHAGAYAIPIGVLLWVSVANATGSGERPVIFVNPVGAPVATQGIRVQWTHSGAGVFWFVIEREEPSVAWTIDASLRSVDDTSVQQGRVYRYRVCAVYAFDRACSGPPSQPAWVGAQLPGSSGAAPEVCTPRTASAGGCAPTLSFASSNYRDRYIRHRNFLFELTIPTYSAPESSDFNFKVRRGLSGANSVSFESLNYPGFFLRHEDYRIKLAKNDGSPLFLKDASFLVHETIPLVAFRFESVNMPGHFIRHQNFELWLANSQAGNRELFVPDTTFLAHPLQ